MLHLESLTDIEVQVVEVQSLTRMSCTYMRVDHGTGEGRPNSRQVPEAIAKVDVSRQNVEKKVKRKACAVNMPHFAAFRTGGLSTPVMSFSVGNVIYSS